jgi:predicted transcriptional regulator
MAKNVLKRQVDLIVDQLPDGASLADVAEAIHAMLNQPSTAEARARYEAGIRGGIAEADSGRFADDAAVKAAFARWGIGV